MKTHVFADGNISLIVIADTEEEARKKIKDFAKRVLIEDTLHLHAVFDDEDQEDSPLNITNV